MGMPGTDWAMSTFAPDIWRIWLMVAPARPMTAPMDSLGTWNCTGIVPGASCAGIGGPPYPGCGPPMCCAAMCWPMPYIAAAAPAAAPRFGSGARAAPAGVSSSLCTINVKAAMTCSTVPETTHFRTSGSPATCAGPKRRDAEFVLRAAWRGRAPEYVSECFEELGTARVGDDVFRRADFDRRARVLAHAVDRRAASADEAARLVARDEHDRLDDAGRRRQRHA